MVRPWHLSQLTILRKLKQRLVSSFARQSFALILEDAVEPVACAPCFSSQSVKRHCLCLLDAYEAAVCDLYRAVSIVLPHFPGGNA